jgi:hypothetical protein
MFALLPLLLLSAKFGERFEEVLLLLLSLY